MPGPRRLLHAAFLRAEALFNRAFGDALNPLYHLGALTFWLFWIVAATGLVLYAFFDTSVVGAYRSVQQLSLAQWWGGGILRSVHRYASDAMVVTMLVHLVRHWAHDRLRGFRWFSWVTGVVLLWLVFAAGANGYMLPWDRLAQFVTQASVEWFDALPGLGGTLVRNFMYDHSVSDRLFSLLVFIHIGVPLLALLLMWVHVQRVPKARTQPPRPLALGALGLLLVLALVLPVASQGGPARLAQAPAALSLDWFLLGLYPLVYAWSPAAVWALVLGGSALLAAAPWLPPRRAGAGHRLTVHPGAHGVSARAGETLLEAGLRAGLALPYDCRAGGCGVCVCTVLQGRIDPGDAQPAALTPAMRARGQALMCCATALEDVEFEVEGLPLSDADTAPQRWRATVQRMARLAPEVMGLWLSPPGGGARFRAGQYLHVVLEDGSTRAFSYANAPGEGEAVELHVRRVPGGRFTTRVFESLREGDVLDVVGPFGRFVLHEGERPLLFIAGATGFAPVRSIVEDALRRGSRRPMWLYWGARTPADLYMAAQAEGWARAHPQVHFVPVLSALADDDPWPGRRGLVHQALLQDHPDLRGFEVYACGSTQMVEAAVPDFLAHGLPEAFCHSDAFLSAPGAERRPPGGDETRTGEPGSGFAR